jgi:altronate hydrolase
VACKPLRHQPRKIYVEHSNLPTAARDVAPTIRLNEADDVVIARRQLLSGTMIDDERVTVRGLIPQGHKLAVRDIALGQPVRRYGQIIGFASQAILSGQHVHLHNLAMGTFEREHGVSIDWSVAEPVDRSATFQGIVRPDGRVATRNYIGILTSVNCSATVARAIADHFRRDIRPQVLADYPNVDGVIALTHGGGCAVDADGEGLRMLRRTLAGYARHVNFSAVLVIGLGCETNQIPGWLAAEGLQTGTKLQTFTIQETGGTANAVAKGIAALTDLLAEANRIVREPVSASHLVVGLQCGGSDTYSGITANPALGAAVDRLVRQGGTAILSETPEIYGAEHLLTRRAVSPEIANKLLARIRWWEQYGWADDHPREVAGRCCQRRYESTGRRHRIRRSGAGPRLGVHGHAGLRPGVSDRSGGRWCQPALLHDWTRLRVRLCACSLHQTRHQQRAVATPGSGHGPELRRHR